MATTGDQSKPGARPNSKADRNSDGKRSSVIKKYANRRLYNTDTSAYVTLDDLAEMIRAEQDFVVVDAKTGEDLTRSVLTQIILEQEGTGENLLPISFLRQLIRYYGDSFGMFVPSYLEVSMAGLAIEQEKLRAKMAEQIAKGPFQANPFGAGALEAIQEQARQNAAMFQQAMSMFSPFGGFAGTPAAEASEQPKAAPSHPAAAAVKPSAKSAPAPAPAADSELSILRQQMQMMQQQLDRLANGKG